MTRRLQAQAGRCMPMASCSADAMQGCADGEACFHASVDDKSAIFEAGSSPAKPQDHDSEHEQGGVVSSKVIGLQASDSQQNDDHKGLPPGKGITPMTGAQCSGVLT